MPATRAYPSGTLAPASRSSPEMLAERVSTTMSGPGAVGDMRRPAVTAMPSRAAVTPTASQIRADGRRDTSAVIFRACSPQQGPDGPQQLPGSADNGAPLADDRARHRAPARLGREQQVVIPRRTRLIGHVLREPLTRHSRAVPEAGDATAGEDRWVDRRARPAEERHPDHQHPQAGVGRPAQDIDLHPTGACETRGSSGGEDED